MQVFSYAIDKMVEMKYFLNFKYSNFKILMIQISKSHKFERELKK